MTTVPPSINPALPQMLANAAASPASATTIAAPPAALAALPAGSTIEGTVAPTPDPRVLTLQTAAGPVSLRTPAPLPDGATVTLEVLRASTAQVSVRLVAVDGAPVQLTPQQAPPPSAQLLQNDAPLVPTTLPSAPGTPPPMPAGSAWWPGGAQPITAMPIVSGFVVAAPPAITTPAATPQAPATAAPTPTSAPALPPLTTGTEVAVRVTSITLPAPGATITLPAAGPNTAPVAQPASATPTALPAQTQPVATPQLAAPTRAPAQAPITIADLTANAPRLATPEATPGLVLPKGGVWETPAAAPPAQVQPQAPLAVVNTTVIAVNNGVPVVKLDNADVQLNVRANLPVGTQVTLEVRGVQPPLTPLPVVPTPPPALVPLSPAQPTWTTLTESLNLLQRSDPIAAQQLANVIPDGGPRTAAAIMSFVQAMRSGETRQWPGDTLLRAIERASPRGAHLAAQLGAEIDDLARTARSDVTPEWRMLPLPWQNDGRVERLRMVFREIDGDDEAEKRKGGGGGTRFLVDLDLSRLGPLQLDGIFKGDKRSLDLMIRTKTPLSEDIRRDLGGVFANSNAAMNLVGNLTFQVVRKFADPTVRTVPGDKSGVWV